MATLLVTDANRGQEIATNGVLISATLKRVPTDFNHGDYLSISNSIKVGLHMHIATSYVSVDSILFTGNISFDSLVVEDIPDGCEVELEFPAAPTLTALVPNTAESGSADFVLSCQGTEFTNETIINFAGQEEPTTFVSNVEVTTIVKPSLFAPATVPVYLHTGDLQTASLDFTFTQTVLPVLSAIVPTSVLAGSADFTLSCQGSGFTDQSRIYFGGQNLPTTFVSSTEITTVISPSLFSPGEVGVAVSTGDLWSDPLAFTFT